MRDAAGGWSRSLNPTRSRTHDQWFLWERVFPSDYKCSRENRTGQLASCPARFPGCICSQKRVPTKTIWEAVGSWFPALRVQFFARALRARALRALASHGSGLTWLWPHMALAIDHVRVMQRVAGPEA